MKKLTEKELTKLEATNKAKELIASGYGVDNLCKSLGISKPTIYRRLIEHDWKLGELALLKNI